MYLVLFLLRSSDLSLILQVLFGTMKLQCHDGSVIASCIMHWLAGGALPKDERKGGIKGLASVIDAAKRSWLDELGKLLVQSWIDEKPSAKRQGCTRTPWPIF